MAAPLVGGAALAASPGPGAPSSAGAFASPLLLRRRSGAPGGLLSSLYCAGRIWSLLCLRLPAPRAFGVPVPFLLPPGGLA